MHLFVGTVLAAEILTFPCEADEMFQKYGSTAGWDIFVNLNMGPGCLIAKQNSPAGTQAEIGIDASGELRGNLALYTKIKGMALTRQQPVKQRQIDIFYIRVA